MSSQWGIVSGGWFDKAPKGHKSGYSGCNQGQNNEVEVRRNDFVMILRNCCRWTVLKGPNSNSLGCNPRAYEDGTFPTLKGSNKDHALSGDTWRQIRLGFNKE